MKHRSSIDLLFIQSTVAFVHFLTLKIVEMSICVLDFRV